MNERRGWEWASGRSGVVRRRCAAWAALLTHSALRSSRHGEREVRADENNCSDGEQKTAVQMQREKEE